MIDDHSLDLAASASPEQLNKAFRSLLERPNALVSAVNAEGLFVPMPPSVEIERSRVLQGRSGLDLVIADDRVAVIEAWYQTVADGSSRLEVHLVSAPDTVTTVFMVDLTAIHGTFFYVLLMPVGMDHLARPDREEVVTSRLTWTKKDDTAAFLDADPHFHRVLGWTRDEILAGRSLNFIHPDDHEVALDNWMTMLASGGDGQRVRLRHLHKDGEYVWVEIANANNLDDASDPHVLAHMIDISEEMAAQTALAEREQLLNRLAEALPSGLLHVRADRTVVYTNERFHAIVAVGSADVVDKQLSTVIREDWSSLMGALDTALSGEDVDVEVRLRHPGADDERLCHIAIRSLADPDGTVAGAILSVDDVTESAAMREELRRKATYDALTQCYNRAAVMQVLDDALAAPERPIAAVFIDLDRFKAINDELGHAAGDELLVTAADRLRTVVRANDVVGRIGGDEFLVVCPDVGGPEEALEIAERVAATLRREVVLDVGPVDTRASVGVAWSSAEVTTADELVARADLAMYESKRRAIGRPVPYSDAMRTVEGTTLDDERALHQALDHGELVVHFQPIVDLETGRPLGYESLVRWARGSHGLAASEFIEMAESTGLIHDLGAHVRAQLIEAAVGRAHDTSDSPSTPPVWFSNVSMQELRMPGIVDSIVAGLDAVDFPRAQFVVEVRCDHDGDVSGALESLRALHDHGIGLSLDDLGAGGASLELLHAIPLTWAKIAPSFTAAMSEDPAAAGILEALLALSDRLGVSAVVKGVETETQRTALRALGARWGQGHLFAPAAPLAALKI